MTSTPPQVTIQAVPEPKPPPSLSKTLVAALLVVVPALATATAGYLESKQARSDVAAQGEARKVDVAQTDVWLRDQWLASSRETALLRAEIAEVRGQVAVLAARRRDRDRDRARPPEVVAEDFVEQATPAVPVPVPAPMPSKPAPGDARVQAAKGKL